MESTIDLHSGTTTEDRADKESQSSATVAGIGCWYDSATVALSRISSSRLHAANSRGQLGPAKAGETAKPEREPEREPEYEIVM